MSFGRRDKTSLNSTGNNLDLIDNLMYYLRLSPFLEFDKKYSALHIACKYGFLNYVDFFLTRKYQITSGVEFNKIEKLEDK